MTDKIDWKNAPDGATHYSKRFGEFYKAEDGFLLNYQNEQMQWIVLKEWHVDILNCEHLAMVKRPESIADVARSIEAARVDDKSKSKSIESTLAERRNQYGSFGKVAGVSQHLQSVLSCAGADFDDVQQEAVQMICSKLARLACGDASHVDSWHDIAGYATLVVKDVEKEQGK